jgi:hypothetical protein
MFQVADETPSKLLAAFSIVVLHIPQFPLTPNEISLFAKSLEISVVVEVLFFDFFEQLVKLIAIRKMKLKIMFFIVYYFRKIINIG